MTLKKERKLPVKLTGHWESLLPNQFFYTITPTNNYYHKKINMDGQRYLYDYFKTCRRYGYYRDFIRRCNIKNDDEREDIYIMFNLAGELAFEAMFACNDNNRNMYLSALKDIDKALRERAIYTINLRRTRVLFQDPFVVKIYRSNHCKQQRGRENH